VLNVGKLTSQLNGFNATTTDITATYSKY